MELMDCNLREYICDHGPLNERTCANFTAQILAGVAHLQHHVDLRQQLADLPARLGHVAGEPRGRAAPAGGAHALREARNAR